MSECPKKRFRCGVVRMNSREQHVNNDSLALMSFLMSTE